MNNFFKAILLLAAVCAAAGCGGSAVAENTDTTTPKPFDNTITSIENSEQPLFQKKYEITDWTMDELVSNVTICGKKITIPCTMSELSKDFNLEKFDYSSETDGKFSKGCEIYCENVKVAFAYCNAESDNDIITTICLDEIISEDAHIPEINIMGITKEASANDLVEILGEPNVNTEYDCDYRYFFSNNQHLYISFSENLENIVFISLVNNS